MKRFVPYFVFGILCLLLCLTVRNASADVFRNGQKICFYGDSITHGGRFHYMIYDYYLTRFPNAKISFLNAGVAGDTASGAITRIEEDVFSQDPDVVVLMFGMNDVGRGNYVSAPSEDQLRRQEGSLKWYAESTAKLAGMLQEKLDPHFIFLTPSPFDQTGVNDRNNNQPGCNDGLGRCAEIVKALAAELASKKAPGTVEVVDLHAPMTAFNAEKQKNDPRYTIIGPDRVHPGAPGHLMMAWLFLKSQNAPALVSRVVLEGETVLSSENAVVRDLQKTDGGLACTVLAKALPFPIDPGAYSVLEDLPIVQDLNREIFCVKGLSSGNHELLIDGEVVGTYTAEELQEGVALAMNDKTPQFRQAQQVRVLGLARRDTEVILRNYAAVRWYLRRWVDPDDLSAVKKIFDEKMAKSTGYFETKVPGYLANWENRGEVLRKLADQTEELEKMRIPSAHRYEVRPCAP